MSRNRGTAARLVVAGLVTAAVFGLAAAAATVSSGEEQRGGGDAKLDTPPLVVTPSARQAGMAVVREHAGVDQAPALADGTVTVEEYREGVVAEQGCLRREISIAADHAGIDVAAVPTEAILTLDRFRFEWSYTYDVSPADAARAPDDALDIAGAIALRCARAHSLALEQAYQLGLRADRSYVEGVVAELDACIRDQGASGGLTVEDAVSRAVALPHDVGEDCLAQRPSITTLLSPEYIERAWEG